MMFDMAVLRRLYRAFKKRHSLGLSTEFLQDPEMTASQIADLRIAIGRTLSKAAWTPYHARQHQFIERDIKLMERAWALAKDADVACRLGLMYQRANRGDDATILYKEALRLHPRAPQLRYQASTHVLRFAEYREMRAYFGAAMRSDPGDLFSEMVEDVANSFEPFVEQGVRRIRSGVNGRPPFLFSLAIWGEPYVSAFMNHVCAALLADGNLPALATRHLVHFVVFTTAESEVAMRSDPIFSKISRHATVHFFHFKPQWVDYANTMPAYYGAGLGRDYAQSCKFLLFSCAHYATLEMGRHVDGLVSPIGSDNVFNDRAFGEIAEIMRGPYDAMLVTGFRLLDSTIKPIAESRFRRADGVLQIPEADYSALLARHIPENYFVHSGQFAGFPLLACWRISEYEVLVHSNHYHPVCIRPSAINRPIQLTIDPTDGHFLARGMIDSGRLYLVQDTRVTLADWGSDPLIVPPSDHGPDFNEISLWLWMHWDSLRAHYFRTPFRIGRSDSSEAWAEVEAEATAFVERILAEIERRESTNERRRSWLPETVPFELRRN